MRSICVDTWFCDHERRPHSGVGRVVRLETDIHTWFTAIVMAWEDHIDPFHGLSCHIVHPRPEGGDPDVFAHVILLQRANPQMVSTLVSISDTAEDPWHPRLMCFTLDRHHLLRDLVALVDLNDVCATPLTTCRAWWQDQEITATWDELISHGAAIFFSVHHSSVMNLRIHLITLAVWILNKSRTLRPLMSSTCFRQRPNELKFPLLLQLKTHQMPSG